MTSFKPKTLSWQRKSFLSVGWFWLIFNFCYTQAKQKKKHYSKKKKTWCKECRWSCMSGNDNYYMANPVLGKSMCSDWFFLGQDFAVRTISMETVQSVYFCFGAKPANSKFTTKTAKKKCENCHSSHWNYQQELKRLKFFRNFKDEWRRRTFFKCKPPEVHFTIRNRVPYNKLLTNRACLGRTWEYWPSVVFVRTERSEVRTVTANIPSTALALG